MCRLNWDVGFVTSTMLEIGVQLPRLLEVYDQLFKTRVGSVDGAALDSKSTPPGWKADSVACLKDPCWQRLKKPLHLMECIHVLLLGYVEGPMRVPTYDR